MKKYIFSILFVVPFIVNAQQVQDSSVCIPNKAAKQIVKDLIDYDQTKNVLGKTQETLKLTELDVTLKEGVISLYRKKELNYLTQIKNETNRTDLWKREYYNMEEKYNQEKHKRKIEKIGLIAAGAILGFLYITK